MLKCNKCGKDCPYAEAPSGQVFTCYECKMIHSWIHGSPVGSSPIVQPSANGRIVKPGDFVFRYPYEGNWNNKTPETLEVGDYMDDPPGFTADYGNRTCRYNQVCVWGKWPYYTHTDGTKIIPHK